MREVVGKRKFSVQKIVNIVVRGSRPDTCDTDTCKWVSKSFVFSVTDVA